MIVTEDPRRCSTWAPHTLAISRPDEVKAAKEPILSWRRPEIKKIDRRRLQVIAAASKGGRAQHGG